MCFAELILPSRSVQMMLVCLSILYRCMYESMDPEVSHVMTHAEMNLRLVFI